MAVAENYTELFDAIIDLMVDASGPFTNAQQVEYWPEDPLIEFTSDREVTRRLANPNKPHLLISDAGASYDEQVGDASVGDTVIARFRFGVRVSEVNGLATIYKADGTGGYWGTFAIQQWILQQMQDNPTPASGWDARPPTSRVPFRLSENNWHVAGYTIDIPCIQVQT